MPHPSQDRSRVGPDPGPYGLGGLARIRQMSLAEVVYRSRQEALKLFERATTPVPGTGRPSVLRAIAAADGGAAADRSPLKFGDRFFDGANDPAVSTLIADLFPDVREDVIASADRIRQGRFDLLGYTELQFGAPIHWGLDPVLNRTARGEHWSRIDPLNAADVGDSKVIWELNRHQWCVTLAQAYRLTGDRSYLACAASLLESWLAANPPGVGINWSSSLEVAFRLVAWCWTLALLRDEVWLSPEQMAWLHDSIRRHATHISRYLSYYFSPNTHLTGEALGLFYAGVLFPHFRDAARWRDTGARILIHESVRQIADDGVGAEQATCYHRYTIEMYLHFLLLARRNHIPVPSEVSVRVTRMVEFLLTINQPAGTMPSIGDADGGWVLPLAVRAADDCRGIFSLAAAAFSRSDFAWAAGGPAPEVAWLCGASGVFHVERIGAHPPASSGSRAFVSGGFVIMRSGWGEDALRLILNTGSLGLDLTGAHAHADLLSVQCSAFGEQYLVDPGTFSYLSGSPWRDHFRSTVAHNTVTVDGMSQSEPAGTFSWQARPRATLRAWQSNVETDFADAGHDAYARASDPVRHRRRVLFVKPRYWIIVDDLIGSCRHRFALRFQFAPRPVFLRGDQWVCATAATGGLWLKSISTVALSTSIRRGVDRPAAGWVSSHYGRREPAPVAVSFGHATFPVRVVTVVMPVRQLEAPPEVQDICGPDGLVNALVLPEWGETVRIDEAAVAVMGARTCGACAAGSDE